MKLLLIAEESAGLRALKEIANLPHEVLAVMTTERPDDANSVWNLGKQLGYDVWPARLVTDRDFGVRIRRAKVDVILNIHSLHLIVEELLLAPRIGSFNLHPGPLPRYAGLNAPSWAIFRGEKKHGVTLHKMEARVDAGAIVFDDRFEISEKDTGLSVMLRCVQLGIPLVVRLLEMATQDPDSIPYRSQNMAERRYYGRQVPYDGVIQWDMSARSVYDFIRASDYAPFSLPWGRPRTYYQGREIAVTKAALTRRQTDAPPGSIVASDGRCYVACADEWIRAKTVYHEGRSMAAEECLSRGGRFEYCEDLKNQWRLQSMQGG